MKQPAGFEKTTRAQFGTNKEIDSPNALEPTRPVIFCDPENGWNEIIPPDQLESRGQLARLWEMYLRKEIFWGTQMGDDFRNS